MTARRHVPDAERRARLGAWAQRRDGSIPYLLLEDIGPDATRRVEDEVQGLRDWLGEFRIVPRFRTPIESELCR